MRYDRIYKAKFIERPNRFIAYAELNGKKETVHVKNTGRCAELLRPGADIYIQESDNPSRKTRWDLIAVKKGSRMINMDSQIPNKVVKEWIEQGNLFENVTLIRPETVYKNSRFDLYVEAEDQNGGIRKIFIEIKGVTLEENGVCRFPDAPSERAVKHLEELSDAKKRVEELEHELKILLLPKDPNDSKNVIVEIRGGAGGDEAALFAAEIYRMYVKYAESRRWKTEMLSLNENGIGGFKEVTFMIKGEGAYSRLKYESGVHRVQRVPETESGGRIHTSTATVAIMPEAEEFDVVIDDKDIRIDVMRASGNGGQCVNTTDSAVRLTHIPTGIVISCQDEKSQLKNKDKALRVLRSRLYEMELAKQHDAEAEARRSQIGTGDRSEKIRTYNFPQGRVTDHRIKLTLHRLENILNGDLDEIIDSLIAADQAVKLTKLNEQE